VGGEDKEREGECYVREGKEKSRGEGRREGERIAYPNANSWMLPAAPRQYNTPSSIPVYVPDATYVYH